MPMKLELDGIKQMQVKLNSLQQAVRDVATRNAVKAAAGVILSAMEARAPLLDKKTAESTALDPGVLKASLRISIKKYKDGYIVALIGPSEDVQYVAHWVEYGHRLVRGGWSKVSAKGSTGPGTVIGQVQAHPFIRPATDESEAAALDVFATELDQAIRGVLSS